MAAVFAYDLGVVFSGTGAMEKTHAWEMERARAGHPHFAEKHKLALLTEDRERAESFANQCAAERETLGNRLAQLSVDIQSAKARAVVFQPI